jgi:hypothetical protein
VKVNFIVDTVFAIKIHERIWGGGGTGTLIGPRNTGIVPTCTFFEKLYAVFIGKSMYYTGKNS